jgi:hypothetical protein
MVEKDGDIAVDIGLTIMVEKNALNPLLVVKREKGDFFSNICRGTSKEEARQALRGQGPPRRA